MRIQDLTRRPLVAASVTVGLLLVTLYVLENTQSSSVVSMSGGEVVVDGVANDPVGSKVEAARFETPLGTFRIETYDSRIGACADVVYPAAPARDGTTAAMEDMAREAQCLAGSGIVVDKPVTTNPDTGSTEGLSSSAWNASLTHDGVGFLVHGFAHPDVEEIRVVPFGTGAETSVTPVAAPNVDGLSVYLLVTPPDVTEFRLVALDADGCRLDVEVFSSTGAAAPPGALGGC